MKNIKVKLNQTSHRYSVKIDYDSLKTSGELVKLSLPKSIRRIAVITNRKVFLLFGSKVVESLENQGFSVFVWQMRDGERYKTLYSFENAVKFLIDKNLKRNDAIIALGGGVVGDLAGFTAASYLRGIVFLHIPTTLLSMIDSSIGGKTGINCGSGKNLIGAFHQPSGILIDVCALKTLPRRELTSGFCEVVRQSAVAHRALFNQTKDFLETYPVNTFKHFFGDRNFLKSLEKLIADQVLFKAEVVSGDEREDIKRTDARSRKILNFGHTIAHGLEKITNYKYFKHGEAVGYGVMAAGEISKSIGMFSKVDLELLNETIRLTGNLPKPLNIDADRVIEALAFDKKFSDNVLQWVLLEEIGSPKIVSSKEISRSIVKRSIQKVLKESF